MHEDSQGAGRQGSKVRALGRALPASRSIAALLLLLLAILLGANDAARAALSDDPASRYSTVPHDPAVQQAVAAAPLERLVVMNDGVKETLPTFARLKIYELTGREHVGRQNPAYTVLSMIYENEKWMNARIFPIEHPDLMDILRPQDKWVSARFVFENPNIEQVQTRLLAGSRAKAAFDAATARLNAAEQILQLDNREIAVASIDTMNVSREEVLKLVDDPAARAAALAERKQLEAAWRAEKPFTEAATRLLQRVQLLPNVGQFWTIVPDEESIEGTWVTPRAGATVRKDDRTLAAGLALHEALRAGIVGGAAAAVSIAPAVERYLAVAEENALYPTARHRALLNAYVRYNPFGKAAWIYMAAAIVYGLFFFFQSSNLRRVGTTLLFAGLVVQTAAVSMRFLLTGHVPVSNMYESITFTSWVALALAGFFELRKRSGVVGLGAAMLGFLMLTASSMMPLHDTRIHPLRAVLNSYWLNIHVTMMLISYAAFALAAVFAGGYLLKSWLGRESLLGGGKAAMELPQMEEFAYRLVQVGWPVLTVGITLGGVWADTAWGRFWGWDPKETWAFITWIVYTIYLHSRMVMGWRGRTSALACVIGFICVLITWLGVSYLPWFAGGLHTYASPT